MGLYETETCILDLDKIVYINKVNSEVVLDTGEAIPLLTEGSLEALIAAWKEYVKSLEELTVCYQEECDCSEVCKNHLTA